MKRNLLIIHELRKNARETLTNISKKTKIPISTIYEKIRGSEGKLILKHTSLIDFGLLGFNARANIMLKSAKEKKSELKDYLERNGNINSMYKINNGYDYLIECVFPNMKDLEDFVDRLDERFSLERKEVFYIIDDIKRETFLTDQNVAPSGLVDVQG